MTTCSSANGSQPSRRNEQRSKRAEGTRGNERADGERRRADAEAELERLAEAAEAAEAARIAEAADAARIGDAPSMADTSARYRVGGVRAGFVAAPDDHGAAAADVEPETAGATAPLQEIAAARPPPTHRVPRPTSSARLCGGHWVAR